jgi:hypothetical protein
VKPSIFISYSHKDEVWKDKLRIHLDALRAEDENFVDPWDDERIGVGARWKEEIEQAMDRATIAVLLVSANFLTSKFILREEVPRLLARAEKGLRIVPVIIRACNWQRVNWLSRLQVRPKNGRVINNGTEAQVETDLAEIVDEIATILDEVAAEPQPRTPATPTADPPSPAVEGIAPAPTSADAHKADVAVREVTKIAARADVVELNRCRRDLQQASDAIVSVTTCKELHDELHTFESESYADILNEHTRIDKDPRARENLRNRAGTLLGLTQQARALASRLPDKPEARELVWIKRLEEAHVLLLGAINAQNVARAAAAVTLMTRVLDMELDRLNETMFNQAAVLDQSVAPVNAALEYVHDNASELGIDAAREGKVRDGIDAFSRLISKFMDLINEHNLWQRIEGELRIVETSLGSGFEQLDILWPQLRAKVEPTLAGRREVWATGLQARSNELVTALALRDPMRAAEICDLFARFRRACAKHFLFIDDQLREECGKLANVDESLQLLIRMIDHEGTQ